MIPIIIETTLKHLENFKEKNLINGTHEFEDIAGEIVGKIFFGEDFTKHRIDGQTLTEFLQQTTKEAWTTTFSLPNFLFGPRFIKAKILPQHKSLMNRAQLFANFCNEKVYERIEHVKANRDKVNRSCLLDIMILDSLDNPDEGMKVQEIVEEFATFIAAGTDTTGHTINLCLYYYLKHPEYSNRLLQEVNTILKDPSSVTHEDVNKMNLMQGYLNETLRLGAPTFRTFFREAIEDNNIGDLKIKKGTWIALNFFPNNYSELYHEDPFKFNPDRWVNTNSLSKISLTKDPYSFVPFSVGSRNCIGKNLATLETKLIVGLFIKMFDASLDSDFDLKMITRFLYEPDKEIIYHIQQKQL